MLPRLGIEEGAAIGVHNRGPGAVRRSLLGQGEQQWRQLRRPTEKLNLPLVLTFTPCRPTHQPANLPLNRCAPIELECLVQ